MSHRAEAVREHFDRLAPEISRWRRRNRYYHRDQINYFRYLVSPGKMVLELGSGTGELLNALEPTQGVGIDISPGMVAQASRRYPALKFIAGDANALGFLPDQTFDYIILSDLVGYLDDIEECLLQLHRLCKPETRLLISYYNFLWYPVLSVAEKLGLKAPTPEQSWLSPEDLANLLLLTDFDLIKVERRLLFPKYVPALSTLLNAVGALPGINRACLSHYLVARPRYRVAAQPLSTSIVIACRDERGNIEEAVKRTPTFGSRQEIIFVDGHSRDGTVEEIERVMKAYPGRDIKLLVQDGTGKGDAVRKGFLAASGEILMILDADLTVPPEDLPKFYRALATGKAEFANGCRLIYPMEDEAMRSLNLLANKVFAWLFTWLLGQKFKDTLCGTKAISRADYTRLAAGREYFGDFDPFGDFDLIFGASKLNLRTVEIPIRYRRRLYGDTKISRFRHGLLLLRMVVFALRKIKWV